MNEKKLNLILVFIEEYCIQLHLLDLESKPGIGHEYIEYNLTNFSLKF